MEYAKYIIDILILLFIGIFTFINYKRGLIKVAFKFISFFLAIIIAAFLYKPISSFIINKTNIDENLASKISTRLSSSDTTKEETTNIVSNYYKNIKNSSISIVADNISKAVIKVGCMILVFVISSTVLLILNFSGDFIAKLPLIKQCNSVGGFIYGFLLAFLLVYVALAIIAILTPILNINNLVNIINSSIVANIMFNNNLILILFS